MCILDIIDNELKEQNKTQKMLCEHLGIKQQAYSNWKGGFSHSYKKYLPEIAEYLGVPIDYLLGKTDKKEKSSSFAEEKKSDIAEDLSHYMEILQNQEALMFDGEPLDDESKELLLISLENTMKLAKKMQEKKSALSDDK